MTVAVEKTGCFICDATGVWGSHGRCPRCGGTGRSAPQEMTSDDLLPKMTVADLISALAAFDPDLEVFVPHVDSGWPYDFVRHLKVDELPGGRRVLVAYPWLTFH